MTRTIVGIWRAFSSLHQVNGEQTTNLIDFIELQGIREVKNKEFLMKKYVVEGLSISQIADLTCTSRAAVWQALKDFQIPIRTKSQGLQRSRKSQLRYGYRRLNGVETPHLGEQKIIAAAREMKAQGLSLRKIAQILTQMGTPTKCQGKSWHPEMVNRILKQT